MAKTSHSCFSGRGIAVSATKSRLSIRRLRRWALLGSLAAAATAGAQGPVGTPHVDWLPQPSAGAGIDLAQVARGFDAADAGAVPPVASTRLLVFISFAMPEGALRRLIADGARSGAVLVLRGLDEGSMVKTAVRIKRLSGGRVGAIQIDPQAFSRFGVKQVPVVVLARDTGVATACRESGCAPAGGFVSVAGDVSLGYALEHVARNAPQFRADAARLRALLEPRP